MTEWSSSLMSPTGVYEKRQVRGLDLPEITKSNHIRYSHRCQLLCVCTTEHCTL